MSALLRPYEVADRLGVDPKTVQRWALKGKLPAIITPGGHRRYREEDIAALEPPPTVERPAPRAGRPATVSVERLESALLDLDWTAADFDRLIEAIEAQR